MLTQMMRQACAELELVSVVGAAQMGEGEGRVKSRGNAPKGETNVVLYGLRTDYEEAESNWVRLRVIGEAQYAVQLAKGNKSSVYRDGRKRRSVAWKQAVANDTRSSKLVARDFGCGPEYVRKLRMQYRRGEE